MIAGSARLHLQKTHFAVGHFSKIKTVLFARFVGQIEVMSPLFSRYALQACISSFTLNRSSWGLDAVWSKILQYPRNKLIVFDCVTAKHTRPVGSGDLYKRIGVDPYDEWQAAIRHYKARKHSFYEYGRLRIQHQEKNFGQFLLFKTRQLHMQVKRTIQDFSIGKRVKEKISRIKNAAKPAAGK